MRTNLKASRPYANNLRTGTEQLTSEDVSELRAVAIGVFKFKEARKK